MSAKKVRIILPENYACFFPDFSVILPISDITGNIITEEKLKNIRRMIESCRRKTNKHRNLEAIVIALKRKRVKRGKEPTYESTVFKEANVITIPDHAGKDVARGTANSILNQCEEDVFRFEEEIEREKKAKEAAKRKGNIQYDDSGWTH